MITDPLFYKLFETSPETLFLLLGMSADAARDMAARHRFEAIEFKETAHRSDGVFTPKDPSGTVYFVELIETVIVYKLKNLTRQEIEAMLQIHDVRESRLWQEAKGEGKEEGWRAGIAIARLASQNKTVDEIAAILKLDVEQVRKAMADAEQN